MRPEGQAPARGSPARSSARRPSRTLVVPDSSLSACPPPRSTPATVSLVPGGPPRPACARCPLGGHSARSPPPPPHSPLSVPLPLPHGYSRSRIRVQILPLVLGCLSFCLGEMGIIQEPPSFVHGSVHEQASDVSPQVWELCPLSCLHVATPSTCNTGMPPQQSPDFCLHETMPMLFTCPRVCQKHAHSQMHHAHTCLHVSEAHVHPG